MKTSLSPIHELAASYRRFLVDFPEDLLPQHLEVPPRERSAMLGGLRRLRERIGAVYTQVPALAQPGPRWLDREFCGHALEAPIRMLWALGTCGEPTGGPRGLTLRAEATDLEARRRQVGVRDVPWATRVLERAGFGLRYLDDAGKDAPDYRGSSSVSLLSPGDDGSMLRALVYYARRVPGNPKTRKGVILEVFLRADMRPLVPGYSAALPHLPASPAEVERTLEGSTRSLWKTLVDYMGDRHPECRVLFRVPRLPAQGWVTDFGRTEKDYGLWSMTADRAGVAVRIVMSAEGVRELEQHPERLSKGFLKAYLERVRCKDCSHCGKHLTFRYAGSRHRLCKTPWYTSPPLRYEDLSDVEELVELRIAHA